MFVSSIPPWVGVMLRKLAQSGYGTVQPGRATPQRELGSPVLFAGGSGRRAPGAVPARTEALLGYRRARLRGGHGQGLVPVPGGAAEPGRGQFLAAGREPQVPGAEPWRTAPLQASLPGQRDRRRRVPRSLVADRGQPCLGCVRREERSRVISRDAPPHRALPTRYQ